MRLWRLVPYRWTAAWTALMFTLAFLAARWLPWSLLG